jgi:phage terminase small subunit
MSESNRAYQALPAQRRVFVDAYVGVANWNATKAARMAGYAEATAKNGYRILQCEDVKAAVSERLEELAMPAREVLGRLSEQARAAYADFMDGTGCVDLEGLQAAGLMRLVKKISWDRAGNRVVEFHDTQRALELLGKHHRLFVDRVEAEVSLTGFEDWSDEDLERFARTGERPQRTRGR